MGRFDEEVLPDPDLEGPDLNEEVRFGAQCRSLVESPAYQEVLQTLQSTIQGRFATCPLGDVRSMVYCRLMLHVIGEFDGILRDAASTGSMSKQEIEQRLDDRALDVPERATLQ